MVHIMSQAIINIGHTPVSCKVSHPPVQGRADGRSPMARTISAEQRVKLSLAQKAYVANDPRWAEHRRKLAAVQEAKRMTLFEHEVAAILAMRKKGRTFSYIAEEIGVCRDVITRELVVLGIETGRVKSDRRARRGKGFWRSFD